TEIDEGNISTTASTGPGLTVASSNASRTPLWRAGWVGGFGVEQQIAGTAWSGRLEYLHYDFGNSGNSTSATTTGGTTTIFPGFASDHLTADVLRAGASYRFGAGSGAPLASADAWADATPHAANWSGFYLGVHGGLGLGRLALSDSGAEVPLT